MLVNPALGEVTNGRPRQQTVQGDQTVSRVHAHAQNVLAQGCRRSSLSALSLSRLPSRAFALLLPPARLPSCAVPQPPSRLLHVPASDSRACTLACDNARACALCVQDQVHTLAVQQSFHGRTSRAGGRPKRAAIVLAVSMNFLPLSPGVHICVCPRVGDGTCSEASTPGALEINAP